MFKKCKKQKKIFNPSEEIINDIEKGRKDEFSEEEINKIEELSK